MTDAFLADTPADPTTSETIEVLRGRVSVRRFADRPVAPATVEAVLGAAFRAPTSSNIQACSVIVVEDAGIRARLSEIAKGQAHIRDAPVFLVFCADLTRIERAMALRGHSLEGNTLEQGLVATIDPALVGMSAYLAADSLGLKGVMIGALRNDAAATAEALKLPRRVFAVFGMCLGWPAEAPAQKPRMAFDEMVHHDIWGNQRGPGPAAQLAAYDAALAAHYTGLGKPTAPDSWSAGVDERFHGRVRAGLKTQLKAQGFDFG
jgi:nitroreductase